MIAPIVTTEAAVVFASEMTVLKLVGVQIVSLVVIGTP